MLWQSRSPANSIIPEMTDSEPLTWETPASPPPLETGEIHLWLASLDDGHCHEQWLSNEERKRFLRIDSPEFQQHFCVTRSLLRRVLANYLELDPQQVRIRTSADGKPYVEAHPLQFNLSHSGKQLLLAFARNTAVGVDLENSRPLQHMLGIARRLFSAAEIRQLQERSDDEDYFFACWTRYEARQKCLGQGIFGQPADSTHFPTRTFRIRDKTIATLAWDSSVAEPTICAYRFSADIDA